MIEILYSYILPPMTLIAFVYIIYLLVTKKEGYEQIEKHFFDAIEKNIKLSNNAIETHFKEMKKRTKQALQKLDTDAREQLQEALSSFEDINKAQRALSAQFAELQRANAELHDEIKKRDAIIWRKTKQIQRLKNAI